MRRNLFLLCICLLATYIQAAVVDSVNVYSTAMQRDVKALVVVPEASTAVSRLPVVYLLHGYGGNEKDWIRNADLGKLADMHQLIIVCPDGRNSWYWDSPVDKTMRYETFISSELPSYVDKHYKTIASPEGRAITGLSMGGHGALWNAFRHPDVFGAAGSMSGGVDIRPFPENWDMKKWIGTKKEQPANWENYTVINLVSKLNNGQQALIFDCGYDDFFFQVNNNLHQALLAKKIEHDYIVRPGAHNWKYWPNALVYQLLFFCKHFDSTGKL